MKIEFTLHDSPNPNAGGMGVTSGLMDVYRGLGHEVGLLSFADITDVLPVQAKAMIFPELVAAWFWRSSADVIDCAIGDGWVLGKLRRHKRHAALICRSHGLAYLADQAYRGEQRAGEIKLSWKYPLYWGGPKIWQETSAMRSADLCLFLNGREREVAIEACGVSPERARVVDNGLPDSLLGRPLAPLDPRGGALRIAHIGRYQRHKGVRYLVEGLESVFARHEEARATLLGTVCDRAEVLADFKPEYHSRVDVVQSFRRADLPALLEGHGVVVSTSLREAWLLGALEGMACGLVPVVTDIPGPTEYVRDGENGLLIPPTDAAALASAVERLIDAPELFAELRAAAHSSAQAYGWARIGEQTLELYAEAIERRRA